VVTNSAWQRDIEAKGAQRLTAGAFSIAILDRKSEGLGKITSVKGFKTGISRSFNLMAIIGETPNLHIVQYNPRMLLVYILYIYIYNKHMQTPRYKSEILLK
jgi:hypothetical protein